MFVHVSDCILTDFAENMGERLSDGDMFVYVTSSPEGEMSIYVIHTASVLPGLVTHTFGSVRACLEWCEGSRFCDQAEGLERFLLAAVESHATASMGVVEEIEAPGKLTIFTRYAEIVSNVLTVVKAVVVAVGVFLGKKRSGR